jgi:hypothetical protein
MVGCSKDAPDGTAARTVKVLGGGRTIPVASASPETEEPSPGAGEVLPPEPHVTISTRDANALFYTVKKTQAAASARAEDPDLAVIASGRVSAAACFTGITDNSASRSASIHVTVLPSGTVNRSEVSTGTTEPWIVSCLEGVGNGLHFSDKPSADIRTYSIDVTVLRSH